MQYTDTILKVATDFKEAADAHKVAGTFVKINPALSSASQTYQGFPRKIFNSVIWSSIGVDADL
jgi:hypothetical protein